MNNELFKWFGSIGLKTDEAETGMSGIVSKAEETGNKLSATFKKAAVAIGTMFAVDKLIDFGKLSVNAAAEAEEFAGAFEQVFKGFEAEAEASMQNVTDTIKASEGRFKESFLQIAGFGKASGMDTAESIDLSNRAIEAAADYAAMYGGTLEDTAGSLQSFLKGNFANDAALGVSATEFTRNAAAVEMYGEKFNELTETQKQWVLLDMVEKANETSGAMGQAAREADSYANTMGELKNAWNEFLIIVGGPILKAVVPVIQSITQAVVFLADMIQPLTEGFSNWIDGLMGVSNAADNLNDSFGKVALSTEEIETLSNGWNELTLEEKQAQVETMGKDDLEGLMKLLGVDFEALPDEFSKDAYLNAHGADALEEVLFLTGQWHSLTLEEKQAVLTAQIDNDQIKEAIGTRDLWNNSDFISQLAEINMNDNDAQQQAIDLINYWSELNGLEPAEIEVQANTQGAINQLEEVISSFDKIKISFESLYDLITGGTIKENTDLMEQVGISDKVVRVVLNAANGIERIRSSLDRFTTLVRTKANNALGQVKDWFSEIWAIIQEIDFETLVENIMNFAESAIDAFTEVVEFLLEFFEPLFTYWEKTIDTLIDLFSKIVTAFNQAMRGDWSGAFNTLKTAIGDALISMGDNILEAWSGIWDNVKELVTSIDWGATAQSVMTFLGNAISGAISFVGDIGATVYGWTKEKLEGIEWDEVGRSILNGIFTAVSKLAEVGTNIAISIFDFISGAFTGSGWRSDKMDWEAVAAAILNGINDAFGFLTDLLGTIALAIVNGIAKGISEGDGPFSEIATNIVEAIEGFVNGESMTIDWKNILGIPDWLWWWASGGSFNPGNWSNGQDPNYNPNGDGSGDGTTASGMSSVLNPNGSGFQIELNPDSSKAATFVSTYDTMATESTTGMNKVNQAIRAGYEAIRTTFTQMESNMVRLMTQIMTKVQEPVGPGMREVNQEFRQGYEPIRTTFTQMGTNLERLMIQAIKKVETAVNTNMASVATAFRSKISAVETAGADTGRGFYNGLNSQRTRIINLANDIATSVLTTMTRALDINSPSGETAWIADMTIEGLYNNLKAGISRIKEVTGEVAGAMLFEPQTADLGFAYGQGVSARPSMTEIMLDEVTQLLKQLRDKDDALYMDGYELGRRGTKYINQENEIRTSRNTRLKGGTAHA